MKTRLPSPAADGKIYLSEYLLRRLENQGQAQVVWIDRAANVTGYIIGGKTYRWDCRIAPKATHRRRTYMQDILSPMGD